MCVFILQKPERDCLVRVADKSKAGHPLNMAIPGMAIESTHLEFMFHLLIILKSTLIINFSYFYLQKRYFVHASNMVLQSSYHDWLWYVQN